MSKIKFADMGEVTHLATLAPGCIVREVDSGEDTRRLFFVIHNGKLIKTILTDFEGVIITDVVVKS